MVLLGESSLSYVSLVWFRGEDGSKDMWVELRVVVKQYTA